MGSEIEVGRKEEGEEVKKDRKIKKMVKIIVRENGE